MPLREEYDGLTLGGGAHKGIGQLGLLEYLFEKEVLKMEKLKYFSGTSIGSLIVLLLILGFSPRELFLSIYKIDNFLQIHDVKDKTIWTIFGNHGFMDIKCITREAKKLILEKMEKVPTFFELADKTGKHLYIPAANLSKMEVSVFSPETTPFMSCLEAVELSCNLPFIFSMNTYRGEVFVDGGLGDNFPYKYIENKVKRLFGVVCSRIDDCSTMVSSENMQIFEYTRRCMLFPIQTIQGMRIKEAIRCSHDVAHVELEGIPFFQLNPSKETKRNMFFQGYSQGELYNPIEEFYVKPVPRTFLREKDIEEKNINSQGGWDIEDNDWQKW